LVPAVEDLKTLAAILIRTIRLVVVAAAILKEKALV